MADSFRDVLTPGVVHNGLHGDKAGWRAALRRGRRVLWIGAHNCQGDQARFVALEVAKIVLRSAEDGSPMARELQRAVDTGERVP